MSAINKLETIWRYLKSFSWNDSTLCKKLQHGDVMQCKIKTNVNTQII